MYASLRTTGNHDLQKYVFALDSMTKNNFKINCSKWNSLSIMILVKTEKITQKNGYNCGCILIGPIN